MKAWSGAKLKPILPGLTVRPVTEMTTLAVNRYLPRQFSADEMSVVVRALRDAISYRTLQVEAAAPNHRCPRFPKGRVNSYRALLTEIRGAK